MNSKSPIGQAKINQTKSTANSSWFFSNKLLAFGFILAFFSLFAIYLNIKPLVEQQYVFLADAFLWGKLHFLAQPATWHDASLFGGKYYWPLGFFPALLLIPFVAVAKILGIFFFQGYLNILLSAAVFYLAYRIAHLQKFNVRDSLLLAFAFCFSSMYLGVAMISFSWQFAHVVSTVCLLLALLEFFTKRRWWLIGLLMGAVAASRITAGIGISFFLLYIIFSGLNLKEALKSLAQLMLPFALFAALIFTYNYLRFENFLEAGYSYQILFDKPAELRDAGLFSVKHVARNAHYSLIGPPSATTLSIGSSFKMPILAGNPWGMSIFLTSPYLLWLFFWRRFDKISLFLLAAIILIYIPLALSFGTGYRQFGFRYGLDFFPFAFLLFVRNYHKKNKGIKPLMRYLIYFSAFLNLYLFFTVYWQLI